MKATGFINIRKWFAGVPYIVGGLAAVVFGFASVTGKAGVETAIGSDVSSGELRALTVESWDKDYTGGGYGWLLETNRDEQIQTKPGDPEPKYEPQYSNAEVDREVKLVKGTPGDVRENQNFDEARLLAVKFAFTFPGYNVATIRPPHVDNYAIERPRPYMNDQVVEGTAKPRNCYKDTNLSEYQSTKRAQFIDCIYGVEMPGIVKKISIWVAGRGNEYDLEGWIEDWKGDTHILKFGSLDFVGWRPLTVEVPDTVPQDIDSFPQIKTIVFTKFKIRSTPQTSLEPVYIFFDELRILTDVFEVHFDGAQLDFDRSDCERKNRLLKVIKRAARFPEHFREPVDCQKAPGPAAPIPAK